MGLFFRWIFQVTHTSTEEMETIHDMIIIGRVFKDYSFVIGILIGYSTVTLGIFSVYLLF